MNGNFNVYNNFMWYYYFEIRIVHKKSWQRIGKILFMIKNKHKDLFFIKRIGEKYALSS